MLDSRDRETDQVAQIVLVHGIAQEQHSASELKDSWLPSLVGGLENAGHAPLAEQLRNGGFTVGMAFYGSQFLTPDRQGSETAAFTPTEETMAEELAMDLLYNARLSSNRNDRSEARRRLAAITQDSEDEQGPLHATATRAVAALDRLPWFSRGGGLDGAASVHRALSQVVRYFSDDSIRSYAMSQVSEHLGPDTRVVIGHSLGSVVAYESLRAYRGDKVIPLFLSLGSPLGLSMVSNRLQPQPPEFPAAVARWVNLAAPDDVVAARSDLHERFERNRPHDAVLERTWKVDNGSKPHQVNFYLTKSTAGAAMADALL